MPVITNISPRPFDSFTVTLSAATDTVLDPQPYNNTKEVLLLNTGADPVWVRCQEVLATPASAFILLPSPLVVPLVGETITIDGDVLTAAGGPYVSGTDTFSVDIRATSTITVNGGLAVGDQINVIRTGTTTVFRTLTGIAGPRAPGSNDFTIDANTTTQAANIVAAINDSDFSTTRSMTATNVGPVITATAGTARLGAEGNTSSLANGGDGLKLTAVLADPTDLTITDFTGGVNADGGATQPSGAVEYNRPNDYLQNIARAIRDPANSFAANNIGANYRSDVFGGAPSVRIIVEAPLGTAGNGLVITEAMTGVTVTSPTAGGVDVVALTAANSTIIPAGGAITLSIGPEGNRSPLQTDTQWTSTPGANIAIVATMATGAQDADLNVTYVNNRGYPFGV